MNAETFEDARAQFRKIIATGAPMFHVDVVDGGFALSVTWGSPEELKKIFAEHQNFPLPQFEVHLMVKNPEFAVPAWLKVGAKRVIVHVESMMDSESITDQAREAGAEAMLAAKPETSIESLLEHKHKFRAFQILAVPPGRAGQEFGKNMPEKIRALREGAPHATIEVDGGMNTETAALVKKAGADVIVSASHILENPDPKKAYEELLRVNSSS